MSPAAQQLLGVQSQRASDAGDISNVTLKPLDLGRATSAGPLQLADLQGLNAGLPKAGFGFAAAAPLPSVAAAAAASPSPALQPRTSAGSTGSSKALTQLTPLPGTAYQQQAAGQSFAFSKPLVAEKRTLAPIPGWKVQGKPMGGQSIDLQQALTKRATFLQRELELQLGAARLQAAITAVKGLHNNSGEGSISDMALREALQGKVSPAHLELAPLLDELVLLQQRMC